MAPMTTVNPVVAQASTPKPAYNGLTLARLNAALKTLGEIRAMAGSEYASSFDRATIELLTIQNGLLKARRGVK